MRLPTSPRVHDLLHLRPAAIETLNDAPSWLLAERHRYRWAVVRRAPITLGAIPIGVRGLSRDQRWATFVDTVMVEACVSPELLRFHMSQANRRSLPAIAALEHTESILHGHGLAWGPGGSVGFELASGLDTVSPSSDLDLVLEAPVPLDTRFCREILSSLDGVPCKVDVRVETGYCSFSLAEYVHADARPILIRTMEGSALALNPWSASIERAL